VEDNSANLLLLTLLLRDVLKVPNFKSHSSGEDLFNYVMTHPGHLPDIVLLDLQLPREDGYHVLGRIRAQPSLCSARVIACTAHVSQSNINRAQSAGFDGFLAKPLEYDRFPTQMQHILAGDQVWYSGK
jgi:CheY-like chemotaxis protein